MAEQERAEQAAGETTAPGRDPRRTAVAAIAVLATVAVVCGVLAGVFFWRAGSGADEPLSLSSSRQIYEDPDNRAYLDVETTAEVSAAAAEIAELLFGLDYADLDGHAERVRGRVSDEVFAEYELTAEVNREVNTQTRTVTTAEVLGGGLGVRSLIGDEAVVTVIVDVQGTVDGEPFANMSSPLQMTLDRIDGEWIVVELAQL